jgi:RNA polymerase sigma-70 factor (ECF subfamily)
MIDSTLEFQKVHEDYRPRILRYLTRLVGESEAEDLVQEVFVKVHQALPGFRGESQLSTWIYRIATNGAIDRARAGSFKQVAREACLDEADAVEAGSIWTGEPAPSLDQQLLSKQRFECFADYVRKLPPKYRAVLVLSELEELPDKEIAEILELSLGAVKIRLHRGRRLLLHELKGHCKAEDWL